MGIFSKLKKAVNYLTGGGAKVSLQIAGEKVSEPLTANIQAVIGDDNLEVKNVYLEVQCVKTSTETVETEEGEEQEENQEILYEDKIEVAEGGVLEAGKEYTFTKEFTLPEDAQPSSEEEGSKVEWLFLAGLDVKGNDPDSGWIKVTLSE